MRKKIDTTIYFPEERQWSVTIWIPEDATEEDIIKAIQEEALSRIEFEFFEEN